MWIEAASFVAVEPWLEMTQRDEDDGCYVDIDIWVDRVADGYRGAAGEQCELGDVNYR